MSAPPDPVYIFRGKGDPVHSLCCPDWSESMLLSGTEAGDIYTWNLDTCRIRHSHPAHHGHVVLWIKDTGKDSVLSLGRDGFLHCWACSGPAWTSVTSVKGSALGFCNAASLRLGNKDVVITPHDKSAVKLTDLYNKTVITSLKPTGDKKYGMCMNIVACERSECVFIGYEDGSVSIWDLNSYKERYNLQLHKDPVMSLDFDHTLQKGVSVSVNNVVKVWKINNFQIENHKDIEVVNEGFSCVKYRHDSKLLATGGWDGRTRLFSAKKNTPLAVLAYHSQSIQTLEFSPDLKLYTGSKDGNISTWNIYT